MEELTNKNSFFDKIPFIIKLSLSIFAGLVLFAVLLSSDFAVNPSGKANFLNGVYTAVSAFTLNGSSIVSGSSYWSDFGICIIMLCMQLGVFCVMLLSNALFLRVGSFISVKIGKLNDTLTVNNTAAIKKFVKYVICYTMLMELLGFILYLLVYIPAFGVAKGMFYSLFSAISAFSNCGMSILGTTERFVFDYNVLYNLVTFIMLFLGSVGFMVICDICTNRKWDKFSFNTKFMIISYSVVIFIGAVVLFFTEFDNSATLGNMPLYTKFFSAFNLTQAVRGAEITRFDFSQFGFASKAWICFMMFTGGMSSSLTGGVKISAVCVCLIFMFKYPFGIYNKNIGIYRIDQKVFEKALFIIMSACMWIFISSIMICKIEDLDYFTAVFETLSSYTLSGITTVGMSSLKPISQGLMIINMLFGRFSTMLLIYAADTNRVKNIGGVEKISKISDLTV